jgi:tetratricopeptide (TPR) repeat protein
MVNWIHGVGRVIGQTCVGIERTSWTAVAAAGILAASTNTMAETPAADKGPAEDVAGALAEDSVLIATHEGDTSHRPAALSTDDDDGGALEPISQTAEHAPELADSTSAKTDQGDDAAQFGRALARVAATETTPSGSSAADLDTADLDRIAAEPAKFNGIQPGTSTKEDVLAAWAEPARSVSTSDGTVLSYKIEPFRSVEVLVTGDTVSAIKVELAGCLPPNRLAKQLSLDKIEAVDVTDAHGVALGQAYPERGVLFMFAQTETADVQLAAPTSPSVTHVVIQPLDANAFALRAENRLHGPYQQNIHDLETALSLEPNFAHAHWLLADIQLAIGQADRAEAEAAEACELEPDNAAYQLRRAEALKMLGRYDDATHAVRAVLDRENTPPIVKAQALHEMALLAALGDASIAAKAISFDTKAIETADSLATSEDVKERRAAKRLLVEAHLTIAQQIASHSFSNKLQSVSSWVGRASGLAEAMITDDGGSVELRLLVAKEALASLASFKPTSDPAPWIAEAKQAADALAQQWDDPLWQRRIQWELGQTYFHAVRIEHSRMQSAAALRYGQLAIENLAEGASTRQAVPFSERLVGELYFQIGAVHAVHKQDHTAAVEWYDKALPLLTAPRPASELFAPQRDGEELVSMGVSYWHVGDKDHAVELTLEGAELVQQAVEDGVLPKSSLGVPYGNLAAMYRQLGETSDAAKYAELARASGGSMSPDGGNRRGAQSRRPPEMTASGRRVSQAMPSGYSVPGPATDQPVRRSSQRATLFPMK